MKMKHLILLTLLIFSFTANAQETDKWEKLRPLAGKWSGEGSGIPGEGIESFSFTFDLEQSILVRKNYSDYSRNTLKDRTIISDLIIIYLAADSPSKAIYFNSDGHAVNYSISYSDNSITFTSENIPQTPTFRINYLFIDNTTVKVRFEMSHNGMDFTTYTESISKKETSVSENGN